MPPPNKITRRILNMIDTKKLLQLVKEHRLLYDSSHPNYNNVDITQDAWYKIGGNFRHASKLAKMKWRYCLDAYDKFLKSVAECKPTITEFNIINYASEIEFVKPYLKKLREDEKLAKYEKMKRKKKVLHVKPTPEQTQVIAEDDTYIEGTTTEYEVSNCASEIELVKSHLRRSREDEKLANYEQNDNKEKVIPVKSTAEQTQTRAEDDSHSEITKTGYNVTNVKIETV